VLALKQQYQLVRFNQQYATDVERKENEYEEEAKAIAVSERCEVCATDDKATTPLPKRGTVMFVGKSVFIHTWVMGGGGSGGGGDVYVLTSGWELRETEHCVPN
jgi:hypothetical protein